MLAAEEDSEQTERSGHAALKFGLTISATHLLWKCNDHFDSHDDHHYEAHVHVSVGGADPLESREASEVKVLTSSKKRPAQRRAGGRFCLWAVLWG